MVIDLCILLGVQIPLPFCGNAPMESPMQAVSDIGHPQGVPIKPDDDVGYWPPRVLFAFFDETAIAQTEQFYLGPASAIDRRAYPSPEASQACYACTKLKVLELLYTFGPVILFATVLTADSSRLKSHIKSI